MSLLRFLTFLKYFIKTKKGLKSEKSEKKRVFEDFGLKRPKRAKKGVFRGFQGGPKKG